MTTENWINVAMVIVVMMTAAATLLGPVLGAYVQVRMSQPKPTPDENQPTAETQKRFMRNRLMRFISSDAFIRFNVKSSIIFIPISILYFAFKPITRFTIFSLVFLVVTPMYHIMLQHFKDLATRIFELSKVVHANQTTPYDPAKTLPESEPSRDASK